MAHLKRYAMPPFWGLGAKGETFVARPRGPHPRAFSIPLQVVLRDLLGHAGTRKEAASILNQGKVLVDKKARKDRKFAVGLMDILEIPDLGKTYRVEVGKEGLLLKEAAATDRKLCRIRGKRLVRGGKEQLNLHDGRNVLTARSQYRVGDSLLLSLPGQEILGHIPLRKGSEALIISGRNRGVRGVITAVSERKYMMGKATVTLDAGGKSVETLKGYVFAISGEAVAAGREEGPAHEEPRKRGEKNHAEKRSGEEKEPAGE